MRAKILTITAGFFFFVMISACKKETAGAKISLKLKSVNGSSFKTGETISFVFEFIPKTTSNDTLFIARKFYTCPFITKDTSVFLFPEWDNNSKGELTYAYTLGSGGTFNGCVSNTGFNRTDSLNYFFWVKDKNGNVSDTIASPKIILRP